MNGLKLQELRERVAQLERAVCGLLPMCGWSNMDDDDLIYEACQGNQAAPDILYARAALDGQLGHGAAPAVPQQSAVEVIEKPYSIVGFCDRITARPTAVMEGGLSNLWMHEDMARDETAAVVNLPRKELQARYTQARDDLARWKRRALESEAAPQQAPAAPSAPAELPPAFFYYRANEDGSVEWGEDCVCVDDVYSGDEYEFEANHHGGKVYSEAQVLALLKSAPAPVQQAAPNVVEVLTNLRSTVFEGYENGERLADCDSAVLKFLDKHIAAASLTAAPAQPVGLSDERIEQIASEIGMGTTRYELDPAGHYQRFARAILAAKAAP